jgi:hypothetical protein
MRDTNLSYVEVTCDGRDSLPDELAESQSERDAGQTSLSQDQDQYVWHAGEVVRDVREGSDLRDEKDDEDDKELSADEKLLDLDRRVDKAPALDRTGVLLCILLHVPFLNGHACIVKGFHIRQQCQSREEKDKVADGRDLQHAVGHSHASEQNQQKQEH